MNKMRGLGRAIRTRIRGWSLFHCVALALGVAYGAFFIRPVFLNDARSLWVGAPIPAIAPIGNDLRAHVHQASAWYGGGQIYDVEYWYPPLATIFFLPFSAVDTQAAYAISTALVLACFSVVTLVLPLRISPEKRASPLIVLLFATGLLSYGLLFELERGQWNVLAMGFCVLAAWLFHYHQKLRLIAYGLFVLAVQLKIWPAIFIVMFLREPRRPLGDVWRLLALGAVNVGLLLALGPKVFMEWLQAATYWSNHPFIWSGNHSIDSFVTLSINNMQRLRPGEFLWLADHSGDLKVLMIALAIGLLGLVTFRANRPRPGGMDRHMLLACTLCAMVVPSSSHDYKLSILAAPVVLLLSGIREIDVEKPLLDLPYGSLVFLLSLAYASTLFGPLSRPAMLRDSLPALMVMLLATVALAFLQNGRAARG